MKAFSPLRKGNAFVLEEKNNPNTAQLKYRQVSLQKKGNTLTLHLINHENILQRFTFLTVMEIGSLESISEPERPSCHSLAKQPRPSLDVGLKERTEDGISQKIQ